MFGKHFKELKGFENYRAYISRREDAQDAFRKVTAKKLAGGSKTTFETFIDVRRLITLIPGRHRH